MMAMCGKCKKISGVLLVLAGIGFLLQDLGVWNFWDIQWYTALILIYGLVTFATTTCKDCMSMCGMKMK
ncbi:MAG: hypothetical protein AABY13_01385 [Nanoarchaeota archaeon]